MKEQYYTLFYTIHDGKVLNTPRKDRGWKSVNINSVYREAESTNRSRDWECFVGETK